MEEGQGSVPVTGRSFRFFSAGIWASQNPDSGAFLVSDFGAVAFDIVARGTGFHPWAPMGGQQLIH